MDDINKELSKILIEKGLTRKWLCQEIGMTESGFKRMLDNDSIKLKTLRKIEHVLDLSHNHFFKESEKMIIDSSFGEKVLQELKEEKDQRIEELKAQIDDLMTDKRFLQKIVEQHLGKLKGVGKSQFAPYLYANC